MDFASLLSKEIAKSKGPTTPAKTTSEATPAANNNKEEPPRPVATQPAPKYISRREAEEARRAAYLAEQAAAEATRQARASAKRKAEEEAAADAKARDEKRRRLAEDSRRLREAKEAEAEGARRKRLGLPEIPPTGPADGGHEVDKADGDDEDDSRDQDAEEKDMVAKFRELGEPTRLFGESVAARVRRYRKLTGQGGMAGPIATTLMAVDEKDMKVPCKPPAADDKKARRFLYRQLASYFNMVLREWEIALAQEATKQDDEAVLSSARQVAVQAMVSSKETMRPLFRKFEKGDLDESIVEAIVEIVKAAQERRYVDANDGYLRLSIGKAAWPIGVTMVGIHERSAREKLSDGARGHIMGGEATRKFLQSIKRCLTFAQVRWPPDDIRQLMG